MYVKINKGADGQVLVSVTFNRQQEPDSELTIEVVFEAKLPGGGFLLADVAAVLVQKSATRTDTRTPVVLSHQEEQTVYEAAAMKLSESLT